MRTLTINRRIGNVMERGRCPKCGYIFDQAETLDGDSGEPRKGDISFCIKCGAVNQFDGVGVVPVDGSLLDDETLEEKAKIKRAWKSM